MTLAAPVVLQQAKRTTTGTANLTGFGFNPVAGQFLLFAWWEDFTAAGFQAGSFHGFGVTDGTTQRAVTVYGQDAVNRGTTAGGDIYGGASKLVTGKKASSVLWTGDVTALITDGVTITWTIGVGGGAAVIIHYLAIECNSAKVGEVQGWNATGNNSTTGLGFQPGILGFLGGWVTATPPDYNSQTNIGWNLGMGTDSSHRWCVSTVDTYGSAGVTYCGRLERSDLIYAYVASGAKGDTTNRRLDLVSLDSDGFTLNAVDAAPSNSFYLTYWAASGPQFEVGSQDCPASTGNQDTTVSFDPLAVFFSSWNRASNGAAQIHARGGVGASDGTTEGAIWHGSTDNVVTSEVDEAMSTTKGQVLLDAGSAAAFHCEGDVTMGSAKFTTNWTTVDGTVRETMWWAIGAEVVAASSTRRRTGAALGSANVGLY